VNSHLLTNETAGVFVFSFSFPDVPDRIYVDSVSILAANIEQCIIEDATLLNGMVECFDSIDVSVSLTKTEPDTIDSVWVMLGDDDRVLLTPSEVDTLWTASIQPSTFPCLATGEYSLSYSATTRFGMSCTLEMGTVAFTNDVQRISNLVGLPDTIHRPMPGDTDILVVAIDLEDCNLLGVLGYNGVRFDAKREPYDWPPAHDPDFRLYDDGTLGDTTAGDGTYTVGLVFAHSDSLFDNLYIFRYYSVECAPPYEQTNYIYDTVRVIQDNGAIQFSVSPDYPLGFSVQPPSDIASAGDRR
jgi:hypothetical protein